MRDLQGRQVVHSLSQTVKRLTLITPLKTTAELQSLFTEAGPLKKPTVWEKMNLRELLILAERVK